MKHQSLYTLVILCLMSASTTAQQQWSLQQCISHAYQQNITVQNAAIAVESSAVSLSQARHARYPNLNASSGANLNFGRTVDPTSNEFVQQSFLSNNIGLNSSVTLYNGGSLRNNLRQAEVLRDAALLDLDQTRNDIALQIATTYLNVLFAEENLEISRQQLSLSNEQLDQVSRLVEAGARAENEKLDIEAQIALNEQNLVGSENNLIIAYLNLKQLLRLDPEVEMQLTKPSELDLTLDPDALTFAEVYQQALQSQAFVQAGAKRVESATLNEDIAKASLLPRLDAGASLQSNYIDKGQRVVSSSQQVIEQQIFIQQMPVTVGFPTEIPIFEDNPYIDQIDQNLSYGFGVQLSVPIYNRYGSKAQIEQAKLNTSLESNRLTQLQDNLKITVQQALADARAAKRRYVATQKSLNASQLAFDNAQLRYDLGAINPIDYVTNKNQLENAQVNDVIAKYDYFFRIKVLDFYLGNELNL